MIRVSWARLDDCHVNKNPRVHKIDNLGVFAQSYPNEEIVGNWLWINIA
jgi:hypothetical protein